MRRKLKQEVLFIALALSVLAIGAIPAEFFVRMLFAAIAIASFGFLAWRHLLSPVERAFVYRKLPYIFGANPP